MKRAIIFCNGNYSDIQSARYFMQATDYIICADGGIRHSLALNIIPHAVIGDFDSIPKKYEKALASKKISWVKHNKEKDKTDSELALDFAAAKGFKTILLLAILGDRLDHIISNVLSLVPYVKKGISIIIIEGKQEIQVLTKSTILKGEIGDRLSLIPLVSDTQGITTNGLKYRLKNEKLLFGHSRGISNVFIDQTVKISLKKGVLLAVHERLCK